MRFEADSNIQQPDASTREVLHILLFSITKNSFLLEYYRFILGQCFDIEKKKNLNNSGSALYQSFFLLEKNMHDVLEEHTALISISAYL